MNTLPRRLAAVLLPLLATAATAQVVWVPVTTTNQPSPRRNVKLAHDTVRDRIVLFGGNDGWSSLTDTWEWDGAAWTQRSPAQAPPSSRGAMAYNRASQCVMFVGSSPTQPTWQYDGVTWSPVATATLPPTTGEDGLVYDAARGVLVLYTMGGPSSTRGQTWEFNGIDWTRRFPGGSPPLVRNAGMVFDTHRQRTVLHGGSTSTNYSNATWEYDGTTWTQIPTTANSPACSDMAFAFDSHRRRAVLLGGFSNVPNGMREYDAGGWQLRAAFAPDGRQGASMVYDTVRQECLLFGGSDGFSGQLFNDTVRCRATTPATAVPFGQGCAAGGVVPGFLPAPYQVPYVGMLFRVNLYSLPYGQPALIALGHSRTSWNGAPLPTSLAPIGMNGCTLYVSPDLLVAAPGSGASASLTIAVPNQPLLIGAPFFLQGVAIAVGANAANLVTAAALDCRIGSP